ncbi:hypothetical protein SDJN03_03345, partial [Cucurbita argyrosperma subsp. sororia]
MSTPRRSPPSTGNRASSDAAPEPLTQSQKNQLQVHFTDEDELDLLNCYLEVAGSKNSQPTLDSPALDRIATALGHKFRHSHIADKLHRLKIQYHKFARTKSFIKTPHHLRILEIGRSIWGKPHIPRTKPQVISRRIRGRSVAKKKGVDLKNFPVLVSEFSRQFPGNGVWREGLKGMEEWSLKGMNEKWVLLHIEEAELKARRVALIQRQIGTTQTKD